MKIDLRQFFKDIKIKVNQFFKELLKKFNSKSPKPPKPTESPKPPEPPKPMTPPQPPKPPIPTKPATPPASKVNLEDEEYISDIKAAVLNKATPFANAILYSVIALIIIGLVWAYFAEIDQTTVANGKVIPYSQGKIIQSLDGGIIDKIFVQEGDMVEKNQPLAQLDDTRYKADYLNGHAKYLALSALVARLYAESIKADKIEFSEIVEEEQPELVKRETQLFKERREDLKNQLALLRQSEEVTKKQIVMYEKLTQSGVVSMLEYYRTKQTLYDIQEKILEKESHFSEESLTELNQKKADLLSLTDQLESLRDKMTRATIRSPVKGVVKKIYVTTIGGVINPGMDIMEIVPLEESLIVEAYVSPSDIAFIAVGQQATVKITAYDYSVYGSLQGKVVYVSADTVENKKEGGARIESISEKNLPVYYVVKVKTDKNFLGNEKHPLPIMPGMTATVHIATGKKTIMTYILKPILKAKQEALRER